MLKNKKTIKKISYLTGFIIIAFLFTSVAFGERIKFSELPKGIQAAILQFLKLHPGEGEQVQTYELLIKKVQTGLGKGAYQAGDIVAAELEGRKWSPAERQNFWIVKMELTSSQAEALTKGIEVQTGEGPDGEPIMETQARRKYYLPVEEIKNQPKKALIDRNAVRER